MFVPKPRNALIALLGAMLVAGALPAPANAYTGFDTTTPVPLYAVMDSLEASFPWTGYTELTTSDPGVVDLTPSMEYCPTTNVPIGFDFTYYGVQRSSMLVSPKGFVTFTSPSPCNVSEDYWCANWDMGYWGSTESQCDAAAEALYGPFDSYSHEVGYGSISCSSVWSCNYGGYGESMWRDGSGTAFWSTWCDGGWPTAPMPATSAPNNLVGIWLAALAPGTCGSWTVDSTVLTKLEGAPGEQRRIIQYKGLVPWTGATGWSSDFQIILFEEDGHIEIHIKRLGYPWGTFVGIENVAGGKGHKYPASAWSATVNRKVAYYPSPTVTLLTSPGRACVNQPFDLIPVVSAARALGAVTGYKWTFPDGSISNLPVPSKTYYLRGNYTVKVDLTFENGIKFPVQKVVRVYNCVPPVARFDTVTDDNSGATPVDRSYDPDGHVVAWHWEWGDGSDAVDLQDPGTHVYEGASHYDVTLTVTDSEGLTDSFTQTVITHGVPLALSPSPTASAGPDQTVLPGATVQLDGRGGDAWRAHRMLWSQGDGTPVALVDSASRTPSFVAPMLSGDEPMELTFSLRLFDGRHLSLPDTVTITVAHPAGRPVADAGADMAVAAATEVVLDGSASSDPDGHVLTYAWEQVLGPEVELGGRDGPKATFTAPKVDAPTELAFRLTVRDAEGQSSATKVVQVVPVATADSNGFVIDRPVGGEPGTVVLRALPSPGEHVRYAWDLGDGNVAHGPVVTHHYATGTHPVLLQVIDAQGKTVRAHEGEVVAYAPERSVPADGETPREDAAPGAGLLLVLAFLGVAALARRRFA